MTGYGREREDRRKDMAWSLGLTLLLGVPILSLAIGPVIAITVTAAVLLLPLAALTALVRRDRSAELRRRAAGEPPSWPAQLPVAALRQMGGTLGRHSREVPRGELGGRLVHLGDELQWQPRRADRRRGVEPVSWDRSWSAEVVPLWGPGRQGCLTLVHPDGRAVDLWIREPSDLGRTLFTDHRC